MTADRDFTGRMVRTVLTVAGVGILVALLWAAREALLLIYVSALIAMGFSPLVTFIERPKPQRGRRRIPRWTAILSIYIVVVAIVVLLGLMVIPPLMAQAAALWEQFPEQFNRLQNVLVQYKVCLLYTSDAADE